MIWGLHHPKSVFPYKHPPTAPETAFLLRPFAANINDSILRNCFNFWTFCQFGPSVHFFEKLGPVNYKPLNIDPKLHASLSKIILDLPVLLLKEFECLLACCQIIRNSGIFVLSLSDRLPHPRTGIEKIIKLSNK